MLLVLQRDTRASCYMSISMRCGFLVVYKVCEVGMLQVRQLLVTFPNQVLYQLKLSAFYTSVPAGRRHSLHACSSSWRDRRVKGETETYEQLVQAISRQGSVSSGERPYLSNSSRPYARICFRVSPLNFLLSRCTFRYRANALACRQKPSH
jgi:hypothetical protein